MPYIDSKNFLTPNPKRLAKPKFVFFVLMLLAVVLALIANATLAARSDRVLELYPTPTIAQKSSTYAVNVNGKYLFVNKYNSINYVHFAFAGTADIEINYKEPIISYTLSPKSTKIPSYKNSNKISFFLKAPMKLILHKVNGLSEELYILADSLEEKPPQLSFPNVTNLLEYGVDNTGSNDVTDKIQQAINEVSARKGVLYIPPGVYKTKQLNLKSDMTLYLAGGSVLEATKDINPSYGQGLLQMENLSNVKIMGRGELHSNWTYWQSRKGWYSSIKLMNSKNILVQDILLIDPPVADIWIQYSEDCTFYNTKILAAIPDQDVGNFPNVGGFNFWSSRNITIDNIIFRGTDDATSFGGDKEGAIQDNENINVRNSTLYNVYAGGAFKFGTTAKQDFVRNVTHENIDVIFANSLVGLWPVTGANFKNLYFKNIRVEDILDAPKGDGEASLFSFRIEVADWESTSSPNNLGYVKNIHFQNLTVNDKGGRNSIFQGYDSQRNISNVKFENFYIEGKLVTTQEEAFFSLISSEADGNIYVQAIEFTKSNPTIVNINARQMYAFSSGKVGEFVVTRTGNISQDLTVRYNIRGTAQNGVDYQLIDSFVTISAGMSEAVISILPQKEPQELETVLLSLENLPNSTQYMLGENFHATVNIVKS